MNDPKASERLMSSMYELCDAFLEGACCARHALEVIHMKKWHEEHAHEVGTRFVLKHVAIVHDLILRSLMTDERAKITGDRVLEMLKTKSPQQIIEDLDEEQQMKMAMITSPTMRSPSEIQ